MSLRSGARLRLKFVGGSGNAGLMKFLANFAEVSRKFPGIAGVPGVFKVILHNDKIKS